MREDITGMTPQFARDNSEFLNEFEFNRLQSESVSFGERLESGLTELGSGIGCGIAHGLSWAGFWIAAGAVVVALIVRIP